MSKFKEYGLACPCGKSSDAYALDQNGDGFCFSCHKYFNANYGKPVEEEEFKGTISYDAVGYRGLSKKTVQHYKIFTKFHDDEAIERGFKYPSGAVKVKKYNPLSRKDKYHWNKEKGNVVPGLYGRDFFDPKDYKYVYITEGEDDAASVYQALGGHHAAVSVQSSSSVVNDIEADYEFLNKFEKIILVFDSDENGKIATKKVVSAGFFDFNKLYVVDLKEFKDANEYLQKGKTADLVHCLKHAKKYTPDNIINTFAEIEDALTESRDEIIGEYPTESLNNLLYGFHRGQVIVVKGKSGLGKTEFFRMCEYHLLKNTTAKLCLIHMEEDKSRTIKGVATYELDIPCTLPEYGVSNADIAAAYRKACGDSEDRVFIYTLFGGDDPNDVLDSIRFVVSTGGVDIVFLDHITLLTTGMEEGDERRKLDYLSTKLKKMAKELGFCLVLISHVNEEGSTRGSKNIELIADTIIHLDRDKMAEDDYQKNVLSPYVEKNRFAGKTGPVQPLLFNTNTYKLEEVTL